MKSHFKYLLPALLCIAAAVSSQAEIPFLSKSVHAPNGYGREAERYEVRIDSVGMSGDSALWDFSGLLPGKAHTAKAGNVRDSRRSIFFNRGLSEYLSAGDSVSKIGYTDHGERLTFRRPEILSVYPMVYRDSIGSYFYAEGDFGQMSYLRMSGKTDVKVDGMGTLILPEGDTLRNDVLRIHLHREGGILIDADRKYAVQPTDSSEFSTPAIKRQMQSDSIFQIVDRWFWFSANHPYPLVEKTTYAVKRYGETIETRSESYIMPRTTQPYAIPTPEEEADALERFEFLEMLGYRANSGKMANHVGKPKPDVPADGMIETAPVFTISPKLVARSTRISCQGMPRNAKVAVFSSSGTLLLDYAGNNGDLQFPFTCDLSDLPSGVYIITIEYEGGQHSETILKE